MEGHTWSAPQEVQGEVINIFLELGALEENGHFVYTSGKHGAVYVAKDLVVPATTRVVELCGLMFDQLGGVEMIDTVIGIAPIGGILSSHLALEIEQMTGRPAFSIFAEKVHTRDYVAGSHRKGELFEHLDVRESLRDFIDPQQRILIVEDVLNTGGSVKKLIKLVRELGGSDIWGVAALWNRGGVTADDLDVPNLFSLCDLQYEAWEAANCPFCRDDVPLTTKFGHSNDSVANSGL